MKRPSKKADTHPHPKPSSPPKRPHPSYQSVQRIHECLGLDPIQDERTWSPNFKTAFYAFLCMRLWAALAIIIHDCDETFNFWEPLHYILFGTGLQTWEYSAQYALRSWFYVGVYAAPAKLFQLIFGANHKILVLVYVRCAVASICALCETVFYVSLMRRLGNRTGRYVLLFLLFSPGMFVSCASFLPNTTAMYCILLAYAAWFQQQHRLAVVAIAFSALICWPFCALVGLPLALDILYLRGPKELFLSTVYSFLLLMVPAVAVDSSLYGRLVAPVLNHVLYNVLASTGGSALYGVEPPSYYFKNLLLNFNLVLPLAFASLPLLFLRGLWRRHRHDALQIVLYLSPAYFWTAFMLLQPHKEERFLYVIYPIICLCAAVSIVLLMSFLQSDLCAASLASAGALLALIGLYLVPTLTLAALALTLSFLVLLYVLTYLLDGPVSLSRELRLWCVWAVMLVFISVSLARTGGLTYYYRAPALVYRNLTEAHLPETEDLFDYMPSKIRVCVGKEWHRFPSSFMLPTRPIGELAFLPGKFAGLLPKPFLPWPGGTSAFIEHMNDVNKPELDRFVNISTCHFIVDLELPSQDEPSYSTLPSTEVLLRVPFLDAARTPPMHRAFYVPYLSDEHLVWADYVLIRNNALFADPSGRRNNRGPPLT